METDKTMAFNMDCMVAMADMKDKEFDLAIVDPPYGIFSKDGGGKTVGPHISRYNKIFDGGTWSSKYKSVHSVANIKEWDIAPSAEYFVELKRVSKYQIIWGANNFPYPYTNFIVWDKKNIAETFTMAMCEVASVSMDGNAKLFRHIPQGNSGDRFHPTQKPIALYKWLLTKYADPGWRILDTHLGSGSSRIAAYDLGFEFVGYELNEYYFNKQEERFKVILPTPTASDIEGGTVTNVEYRNGSFSRTNSDGVRLGVKLRDVVESGLLPTPKATEIEEDYTKWKKRMTALGNPKNVGKTIPNLGTLARNGFLPTAQARDLAQKLHPTPKATDSRHALRDRGKSNLGEEMSEISFQTTGKTFQLNPLFVAEMMGFPPNWTVLPFQSGAENQSTPTATP